MDYMNSILIVDDDEHLLEMFQTALSLEGYQCEKAATVEKALELITNNQFDILIADIKMPGMTGLELTERSKKIRPDMAVIVMTAYIEEFSYDSAIEVGASDFIKKPFTVRELVARIQHVKLQERLRSMSVTDELTGLYNRRGFFTLAEQELRIAKRLRKSIFLFFLDIDNLKEINDQFGHIEGDMMILETSDILRRTFRQSDTIARIGGDEFAVVLNGAKTSDAETVAVRLQKNLDETNKTMRRGYRLSLSIGMSFYDPENPRSIDELLSEADKSMYEQKKYKQIIK
jgi:two-component system cell cycle response regulator